MTNSKTLKQIASPPANGIDDGDDEDVSCWCSIDLSSLELGRSTGKQLKTDADPAVPVVWQGGGGGG